MSEQVSVGYCEHEWKKSKCPFCRNAELEAERIHFEAVAMTAIEENEKLKAEVGRLREAIHNALDRLDETDSAYCRSTLVMALLDSDTAGGE